MKVRRGVFTQNIGSWQHGIEQMAGVECQILDEVEDSYVVIYKLGRRESNGVVPKWFVEIKDAPVVEAAKKAKADDLGEKEPLKKEASKKEALKEEALKEDLAIGRQREHVIIPKQRNTVIGRDNRNKGKQQGGSRTKNVGR
jgi:hypothetical protein